MKKTILLITVLFFCSALNTSMAASGIPSDLKKTITFVFSEDETAPIGTGFFVGIRNEKHNYIYLITAKHVIMDENKRFCKFINIRVNLKNGDSIIIPCPLESNVHKVIYTHPDSSVDIAVIPYVPNIKTPELLDISYIPCEMITTKEMFQKNQISEGEDVFFGGLFTPHYGKKKNYPILRFGRLAMIPEEKILWNRQLAELYLLEIQSFGGNSGSPVFFYLGPIRNPRAINIGPPKILLAGVMIGYFSNPNKIGEIITETKNIPISFENVGIAAVVPAYKLHEILFSDELKSLRE